MLIERCLCGETAGDELQRNGLTILRCRCGMQRLVTDITPEEYEAQYRGPYHESADRHPGCVPYYMRYDNDLRVAKIRWRAHRKALGPIASMIRTALDVGVGNGAWVDYMRAIGVLAYGIDPDPALRCWAIRTGTIDDVKGEYDLVTYHDVLEHVLDPVNELRAARARTRRALVVDVPDVSIEAGWKHYKAEHPWYFTPDMLELCIVAAGFRVVAFDNPLPGKLVAYARPC